MKRLSLRLAIAVLTFLLGVTTTAINFSEYSLPIANPKQVLTASTSSVQKPMYSIELCSWGQQLTETLSQVYEDYNEIKANPSLKKLIIIDQKLRQLFRNRPDYYPCGDESKYWKEEYIELGVVLDYWSDLGYSGKLLADAHKINPRSKYRKHTLFSTLEVASYSVLGQMPNTRAAYDYEREFSNGPFIEDTLLILANFHKDLYMVLRDDLRDYKYDCFKPYIGKSLPLAQMNRAQQRAIRYYKKALSLNPSNERARETLNATARGTINSWHFCAD